MKTKHLFFATALVASFASCTNEEIVEQQGVANVERPTVENVKLNFVGEGVDSRLTFGSKGYAWEASDVIGALLMDQPTGVTGKDAKWEEKYEFSNFVNTSYPFAYNADTKVWSNDAKMLEGNYFFAFPFSSYDGGRVVKHSLAEQTQAGVASKAVAESYAKNQFFVGYSQIFGGTEAEDALEDVEMTSILGGLQFRIINNGTKTYHINKLVVTGTGVASELTLNPAGAILTGDERTSDDFNYANYVGDEDGSRYNKATVEGEKYNRASELRPFVVAGVDGKAELSVTGTKAERAIAKGATGYAVVMVNPISTVTNLSLDIYTDEGVIKGIDLTTAITDTKDEVNEYEGVLVDKAVTKIAHDVANTVVIKFTDEIVGSIQGADIYDEEDLLQLIEWNANSDLKVTATAELKKEVEFTKEMFDLLKSNKNVTLAINGTAKELTLAANLPADVLSYEGLEIAADVELVVEGTIEAAEDDEDKAEVIFNKMTIAEGGVLNVNNADPVLPTEIINEGTINFGEKTIAVVNLTNEEEGIINIVKGADVKGFVNEDDEVCFVNNGTVNNNGYVERIINNDEAVITLGEGATLKGLDNNEVGVVVTANGSLVVGANEGMIVCVTGATVEATGGMIAAEAPATITKDYYKGSNINTLILKENAVTTFNSDQPSDITMNVIASKGSTLKVANGEELVLGALIVEEDLTIVTNNKAVANGGSTLTVGEVEIAEEAELTNNGKLIVTTDWTNEGIVYNNGGVNLYHNADAGTFKYTQPTYGDAPAEDTATVMENFITFYWTALKSQYNNWKNGDINNNPYDVEKMVNLMYYWAVEAPTVPTEVATLLNASNWNLTLAGLTQGEAKAKLKAKLIANYDEFATAIDDIVFDGITAYTEETTVKLSTFKALYIGANGQLTDEAKAKITAQDSYLYNNKTAAMRDLLGDLIDAMPSTFADYKANLVMYKNITTSAIATALEATTLTIATNTVNGSYVYIWTDCALDKAVKVAQDYKAYSNYETWTATSDFVTWASAALAGTHTNLINALTTAGVSETNVSDYANYSIEQFEACLD